MKYLLNQKIYYFYMLYVWYMTEKNADHSPRYLTAHRRSGILYVRYTTKHECFPTSYNRYTIADERLSILYARYTTGTRPSSCMCSWIPCSEINRIIILTSLSLITVVVVYKVEWNTSQWCRMSLSQEINFSCLSCYFYACPYICLLIIKWKG